MQSETPCLRCGNLVFEPENLMLGLGPQSSSFRPHNHRFLAFIPTTQIEIRVRMKCGFLELSYDPEAVRKIVGHPAS
jgi:hypothetical protein